VLKLCDDKTLAVDTIAGGVVNEPCDVRIGSLWHHQSVTASWPREYRAALIDEASSSRHAGRCPMANLSLARGCSGRRALPAFARTYSGCGALGGIYLPSLGGVWLPA
jgi:hypothetical protein